MQITECLNIELDCRYICLQFEPKLLHKLQWFACLFFYGICSDAVTSTDCIVSSVQMILNSEFERFWREVVVCFEVSSYLPEGTKGNHKNLNNNQLPNLDLNQSPYRYKPEMFQWSHLSHTLSDICGISIAYILFCCLMFLLCYLSAVECCVFIDIPLHITSSLLGITVEW